MEVGGSGLRRGASSWRQGVGKCVGVFWEGGPGEGITVENKIINDRVNYRKLITGTYGLTYYKMQED